MSEEHVLTHQAVMLHEAVHALNIQAAGIYIDGTFGRGGHSQAILQHLGTAGRLIAFDKDPAAIAHAKKAISDSKFSIVHHSFADLQTVVNELGLSGKIQGILLDLGVSSPQLDDAERGFSFMREGPLDMRMNSQAGISAAQWLAHVDETELANVIYKYGEERFSRKIARAIVAARLQAPITTTKQLASIIAAAYPCREIGKHPATRTFQAIRIYINRELEDLEQGLTQALAVLAPGGRLAVISFHSLEDRIVKQFMQQHAKPPSLPRNLPIKANQQMQPPLVLIGKAIKPSAAEVECNVRARSAMLRVAEKRK
jgi:16S rRNA (cytosine1402-N4)-methyltransferase